MESSPLTTKPDDGQRTSPDLRDPDKLFFQQDSTRRLIIIAYWAVILLSLPLWWHTTSIERLSLPSSRVRQHTQHDLQLPVRICIEADSKFVDGVRHGLSNRVVQEPSRWNGLGVEVFNNVNCERTPEDDLYTITFRDGPVAIHGRHLYYPAQSEDTYPSSNLIDTLTSLIAPYSSSSDPENRVAQYSPLYRLAFSVLNEDAAAGGAISGWEVQRAMNITILPLLKRMSALHNFTVESQVQFHAPLAFSPLPIGEAGFGITPQDLTVFVNSEEWTLSSGSSNDPVLHFVLFIPSSSRRPLRILTKDGAPSPSSAFLLPQWGGIVIHNPLQGGSGNQELPPQTLDSVFRSFSKLLLTLLGVPNLPSQVEFSPSQEGSALSEWQLDALLRRRTLENAKESRDTLLSIVKLVDQIENMPVGEDVKGDVQGALNSLIKAYELSKTSLREGFTYSSEALSLASRAFFNPGMLALLYFPAEHKYAVYTPLFASAVIPLFVSALREFNVWRREKRAGARPDVK